MKKLNKMVLFKMRSCKILRRVMTLGAAVDSKAGLYVTGSS